MPVSLDLRRAHKHQRHGDIVAVLTWVNDERALVLMPAMRRNAGWYVVSETAAYEWAVDHPSAEIRRPAQEHALTHSHIACITLGIESSRRNRARIISIITGWLPDLIEMPSAPPVEARPGSFGQMILSADGKQIAGEDLRDDDRGVSYG